MNSVYSPKLGYSVGACPVLFCGVSAAWSVHILLLTPFTVAGFALVYLLLKCNLTVHLLCSSKCFPTGDNTAAMHILSTFTAWPNMDL